MLGNFWKSKGGNVAVMFALASVPIMVGVAGAIDFVSTETDASALQNALDASGLAIGTQYYSGMTQDQLQQLGLQVFNANLGLMDKQDPQLQYNDNPFGFTVNAQDGGNVHYISVSASAVHPGIVGGINWRVNRASYVKVSAGTQACVLALDPHLSKAVKIQGSTDVSMAHCVIASNSDASDSIYRGGSAQISVGCTSSVGQTVGIPAGGVHLDCGAPMVDQYPSFDPLAGVVPPAYTSCSPLPGGKTVTLSPGTFCNKTWSGNIVLDPGVYILRGGQIKLGGNGSLSGSGVTIFLMEGAQFTANANDVVTLSPPTSGPYAGVTLYQDHGNNSALTINGGAGSTLSGFVYAPDAPITYAGNSDMSGQGNCIRLVGDSVTMTGNSAVSSDCSAALGNREMYAGRQVLLVK